MLGDSSLEHWRRSHDASVSLGSDSVCGGGGGEILID